MNIKSKKILIGLSRFFSTAANPLLAPTYVAFLVLWVSVLCAQPMGTRAMVLVVVCCTTCLIPMMCIGALHHFGLIKSKKLDTPAERRVPYLVTLMCIIGATAFLNHNHAPLWFTMAMVGLAVSCLLLGMVNLWWKVSAHTAGLAACVAVLVQLHVQGLSAFNLFYLICFTVLLTGLMGSARMILRRGTLWQVLVGTALGYAPVAIAMYFS